MLTSAGIRCMSLRSFASSCQALVYDSHGPPKDALRVRELPAQAVGQHDVHLDILAVSTAAPVMRPIRWSTNCHGSEATPLSIFHDGIHFMHPRLPSTPQTSTRSRASTQSSRRCQRLLATRASVLCAAWAIRCASSVRLQHEMAIQPLLRAQVPKQQLALCLTGPWREGRRLDGALDSRAGHMEAIRHIPRRPVACRAQQRAKTPGSDPERQVRLAIML
jgi:hypothetical protein